jgi:glycosyltransferase involved in cell wall biosynthesis
MGVNPLDEVPGVGATRKRALLAHFGSAKAVSRANLADLKAVLRECASRAEVVLVGTGPQRARLAQRVQQQGLANVHLLPAVPKRAIPSLLQRFDLAYIGWHPNPLYRFGICPNKLMDYMMAGCAVLHSVEAGNDPVAEAGCGLTVAPESPDAVAEGLRRLAALPAAERRAMGERGRAFVQAHHTYPVLAQRFIDAVR